MGPPAADLRPVFKFSSANEGYANEQLMGLRLVGQQFTPSHGGLIQVLVNGVIRPARFSPIHTAPHP